MLMSVRLDARTERLVVRLAKRKAQTKSEVVREAIVVLAQQTESKEQAKHPYDLIAHLIGCVDSGGAWLSEKTGEQFARLLEKRHMPAVLVDAGPNVRQHREPSSRS